MQETLALVTAIAALFGALVGNWLNVSRLRAERDRWRKEFEAEGKRWQARYREERERWLTELHAAQNEQRVRLLERVLERRFSTYGPVLEVLGRVRDYDLPDGSHFQELREHPEQLSNAARDLLACLYGDAGLVMEMDTRNAIVEAALAASDFGRGGLSLDDLCETFFMARRFLRSDLQMRDGDFVKGEMEKMQDAFRRLLYEREHPSP